MVHATRVIAGKPRSIRRRDHVLRIAPSTRAASNASGDTRCSRTGGHGLPMERLASGSTVGSHADRTAQDLPDRSTLQVPQVLDLRPPAGEPLDRRPDRRLDRPPRGRRPRRLLRRVPPGVPGVRDRGQWIVGPRLLECPGAGSPEGYGRAIMERAQPIVPEGSPTPIVDRLPSNQGPGGYRHEPGRRPIHRASPDTHADEAGVGSTSSTGSTSTTWPRSTGACRRRGAIPRPGGSSRRSSTPRSTTAPTCTRWSWPC